MYISRDVVFEEDVFPFAELHSNAGARLRAGINLLPSILLHPTLMIGDIAKQLTYYCQIIILLPLMLNLPKMKIMMCRLQVLFHDLLLV
jgi:hypothetical protein